MTKLSYEAFPEWAKEKLGFDPDDKPIRTWVETNLRIFRSSVEVHPSFVKLQKLVAENQASSRHKTINIVNPAVEINVKSFDSIISKCFRSNVVNNIFFPEKPEKGWLLPDNMLTNINDLIRTTIVCRHINEPRMISDLIQNFAKEDGLECRVDAQAKEKGYYAYHVYLYIPVPILDRTWNTVEGVMSFEIQVTTEMQYILYGLTHVFYEKERHQESSNDEAWKWNYKTSRFAASYISHSLHLLEGMILRLYEDVAIDPNSPDDAESPDHQNDPDLPSDQDGDKTQS